MRINPYYLSLVRSKDDPIWKQAVPSEQELEDCGMAADPLAEEVQSPVANLIHRYPDRVIFIVSNRCAVYCRHCMRKRKIGADMAVSRKTVSDGIGYIRSNRDIRDVILSGGDPLMLEDGEIEDILKRVFSIDHVETVRIHSRVPCTLPQRITERLVKILRSFRPLFLNTHFNHPDEITPEAARACGLLADAGIPLGCQTVLLKGVNDSPETMTALMRKLLTVRVKPYYIHHPDLVRGTSHFRTSIEKGLEIIKALRGHVSGMAVPQYMIDLPGGGGKIPLLPEYVKGVESGNLIVENYRGEKFRYPLL